MIAKNIVLSSIVQSTSFNNQTNIWLLFFLRNQFGQKKLSSLLFFFFLSFLLNQMMSEHRLIRRVLLTAGLVLVAHVIYSCSECMFQHPSFFFFFFFLISFSLFSLSSDL